MLEGVVAWVLKQNVKLKKRKTVVRKEENSSVQKARTLCHGNIYAMVVRDHFPIDALPLRAMPVYIHEHHLSIFCMQDIF